MPITVYKDVDCDTGQTHTFQLTSHFTFQLHFDPDLRPKSNNPDQPAPVQEIIFQKSKEPDANGELPPPEEGEKRIVIPLDKNLYEHKVEDEESGEMVTEYIVCRDSRESYQVAVPVSIIKKYFAGAPYCIAFDTKLDDYPDVIYDDLDSSDPFAGIDDLVPEAKPLEESNDQGDDASDNNATAAGDNQ